MPALGRRKGSRNVRQLPYRRVERVVGRKVYLACGHIFTMPPGNWYPVPKRFAGCETCYFVTLHKEPGLKNYWFARIRGRVYRAFRWGDLMYEGDMDQTGRSYAPMLVLVRASSLESAQAVALGREPTYRSEGNRWRGLMSSRLRRRIARLDSATRRKLMRH